MMELFDTVDDAIEDLIISLNNYIICSKKYDMEDYEDVKYFDTVVEPRAKKFKTQYGSHEDFVDYYDIYLKGYKREVSDAYFNVAQICYELIPKDKIGNRKPMTQVSDEVFE